MSTTIEPETRPGELGPSDVRTEAPTLARLAGGAGLFALTAGAVSVIAAQYGRGLFGEGLGYLIAILGLFGLLVHAARDADVEIRRLYGVAAAALLLAAIVVSALPYKLEGMAEKQVGALLLPYGASLGLVSLLFAVPYARNETDEPYRTWVRYALLGTGGLLCVGSVVAGLIRPDFLVGPGLALAVLGLGFTWAYLSQADTAEGLGYQAAVGLAIVGAVALAVAVGRSVVPEVLYEGPNALKTPARDWDKWKVAARVLVVLLGLVVASLALNRRTPLWLRGVAAVLGLAWAGVFVTGALTNPVHTQPAPFLVPYGLILAGIGAVYLAVGLAACTDNQFVVLTRRELAAYFYSPIAYIVLLGMAVTSWIGYAVFVNFLRSMSTPMEEPIVGQALAFQILAAFQALFLVPALTMRLFSEEKRTGTLEVLMTAPVNEAPVVLSKFAASWVFFMLCWLPGGLYLVDLQALSPEPFDYRPLLTYYLSVGACGTAFLSMGLFFSSLTRNQIIAAVLTFAGMFILLLTILAQSFGRDVPPEVVGLFTALGKLDFLSQWQRSLAGQLPVQDLVVQLSLAGLWLFLTVKVLEARKWG